MRTAAQRLGAAGEQAAAHYLCQQNYQVLDRNWRCSAGELDLVAKDPAGNIVAVEVKTRSSLRFGTGFDAISPAKYRRLLKLLMLWGQAHQLFIPQLRVDVVEVYPNGTGFDCQVHQAVQS